MTWPEAAGHKTYTEYRDIFAARGQDIHDYHIFSVVRNPWAWHVSWFTYIRSDPEGQRSGHVVEAKLFTSMDFADYVDWLEDPNASRGPQGYMQRQLSDWLVDETGRVRVDTVLRQESLFADLTRFLEVNEIQASPPKESVNVSNDVDYRSFYTDRDVDRIAARHQRDIELFGYGFDPDPS